MGDLLGENRVLNNVALVALAQHDYDAATDAFARTMEIALQIEDLEGEASSHQGCGYIALRTGRFDEAEARLSESRRLFVEEGDQQGEARFSKCSPKSPRRPATPPRRGRWPSRRCPRPLPPASPPRPPPPWPGWATCLRRGAFRGSRGGVPAGARPAERTGHPGPGGRGRRRPRRRTPGPGQGRGGTAARRRRRRALPPPRRRRDRRSGGDLAGEPAGPRGPRRYRRRGRPHRYGQTAHRGDLLAVGRPANPPLIPGERRHQPDPHRRGGLAGHRRRQTRTWTETTSVSPSSAGQQLSHRSTPPPAWRSHRRCRRWPGW